MLTLSDLALGHPDCSASSDEARALTDVLFPRRVSNVWSIK
jgi:hypothetical protein